MENFRQFIESLGRLHDGKVLGLQWLPEERRFELMVKDLYADFDGLPEYKGPVRAKFVFSDVSVLSIDAVLSERGLLLHEWVMQKGDPKSYDSELKFSLSGTISIGCGAVECVEL